MLEAFAHGKVKWCNIQFNAGVWNLKLRRTQASILLFETIPFTAGALAHKHAKLISASNLEQWGPGIVQAPYFLDWKANRGILNTGGSWLKS